MTLENQKIIFLICADIEWKIVKGCLCPIEIHSSPFGEWFPYNFDVQERSVGVTFFQTGCGKIPAAAATQFVIDKCNPKTIINLGTCGGFSGKINREDIIIVEKTVIYDINERSGHHDEQIEKYTTELDFDPEKINYLFEKYGAIAADWESGAIAYVAKKNGMECLILRGVSDVVDPDGEPSNEKEIREGTAAVMKILIDGLPKWISKASHIFYSN
jgi:nucleoside phosphorylase